MEPESIFFNGQMAQHSMKEQYEKAMSDPSLRSIHLVGQDFDQEEATFNMLLNLLSAEGRKWNSVKLSSCSGRRMNMLIEAILNSSTRKLIIIDGPIDVLASLSKGISLNSSLLILGLQQMSFTAESTETLCRGLQKNNSVMEILFDQSSFLDDSHLALGRGLVSCSSIQHLSLQGCGMTDEQCAMVCKSLTEHGSVLELNLEGNSCISAGIDALSTLLESTSLMVLDLSAQTPTSELNALDLSRFANALAVSRLRYLQLSDNRLTDQSMESLAAGIQANKSLRILNMAWCNISSESIGNLADALSYNLTLTSVNLFGCGVCDQGMGNLASRLSHMKGLRKLDIGGQQNYTDEGIQTLMMGMEGNMYLEEVLLNSVTYDRNRFYFDVNRGGRRFFRSTNTAAGLWPHILNRVQSMDMPKSCDPWATDILDESLTKNNSEDQQFDENEDIRRAGVLFHLLRNGVLPDL